MTVGEKKLSEHAEVLLGYAKTKGQELYAYSQEQGKQIKKIFDENFTFYNEKQEAKPSLVTSAVYLSGSALQTSLSVTTYVFSNALKVFNLNKLSETFVEFGASCRLKSVEYLTKGKAHFPIQFKKEGPALEDNESFQAAIKFIGEKATQAFELAETNILKPAYRGLSAWSEDEKTWGPASESKSLFESFRAFFTPPKKS